MYAGKYAPILLGGGVGAAGTLVGNVTDKRQDEGPARLATEAALGGINTLGVGGGLMLAEGLGVTPNIQRPKLPGKRSQKLLMAAGLLPLTAGIGGLWGGGVSNVAQAVGIPGFSKGIDPESYGSSNLNQSNQRPNALYQMTGTIPVVKR